MRRACRNWSTSCGCGWTDRPIWPSRSPCSFPTSGPSTSWPLPQALRAAFPELPISLSHEVAPIWREYERGSTTIGDAFIKPIMRDYVAGVRDALQASGRDAPVSMLKSNGGHLGLDQAPAQPAQFLLSGLAGGIVAARTYARLAGVENVFSLDMGGTSADIGTIQGGTERSISEFEVGFGIPVVIPSVDVATLGAGGGSIAWIDKGGLLQVGPESAGAEPGPMCYGKGGEQPTTTDANLALGRLNPGLLPGRPRAARSRGGDSGAAGDRSGAGRERSRRGRNGVACHRRYRQREHGQSDPLDRGRPGTRCARVHAGAVWRRRSGAWPRLRRAARHPAHAGAAASRVELRVRRGGRAFASRPDADLRGPAGNTRSAAVANRARNR